MLGLAETQPTLSTSEALGRISTSFRCSNFWDCLGTQALVIIGRWYPGQLLTNHKQRLSTQTIPEIVAPKARTHSPYCFWSGDVTVIRASPRFGHPHCQNPSEMGILLILLIASWVRVRVTGDAHIGRVLGMGMSETRGSLYHCDSEKRFGFVCTQRKTNVASSPFFTTKCKVFDTIKMYFHIKRFASFCLIFNMRVLQFSPKHTLIHAMD